MGWPGADGINRDIWDYVSPFESYDYVSRWYGEIHGEAMDRNTNHALPIWRDQAPLRPSVRRPYTSPRGTGMPGVFTRILPISPNVVMSIVFQSSPHQAVEGIVAQPNYRPFAA